MNVLYFVIPLALLLGLFFVGAFLYSIYKGQYDEIDSHAQRMLLNDLQAHANDKVQPQKENV